MQPEDFHKLHTVAVKTGNGKFGGLERQRLMENPSRKYFRGPDWSHHRHYESP